MVGEVNDLIRPDFVQFIGDNVQDATEAQFRLFDELARRLEVPHYALVGDHDVKDDPEARGFRAHVGETYGSTSLRGFRFIRLDTQQARPVGLSRRAGRLVPRARSTRRSPRGERVVVFQHNYPYQIWENFDGPGIDDWRAIVQTRRIAAIVCGHTHYWQVANDGRNVAVATRSIGDPEGGPPGYTLAYFHGDDLAVAYRSVEDRGPDRAGHPPARGDPGDRAGARRPRARTRSGSAPGPRPPSRRSAAASTTGPGSPSRWTNWSARAGRPRCTATGCARASTPWRSRPATRTDCRGSGSIRFVVDPTGRYTAVPRVEPWVEQTAFC